MSVFSSTSCSHKPSLTPVSTRLLCCLHSAIHLVLHTNPYSSTYSCTLNMEEEEKEGGASLGAGFTSSVTLISLLHQHSFPQSPSLPGISNQKKIKIKIFISAQVP